MVNAGAQNLISDDTRITLIPKRKKERIWEIDFLRGICVLLMVLDHLALMVGTFFGPEWFGNNLVGDTGGAAFARWCDWYWWESDFRAIAHPTVVFIFFSISGISCSFSRSNVKRGVILALVAMMYTALSYAGESMLSISGIIVNFGVLHFYAACILIYALIDIVCRRNTYAKMACSAAIIVTVLCLYFLYTPPATTPIWLAPLFPPEDFYGNPSLFYSAASFSPGDIFNLIPWSAFFFFGTLVAPIFYARRTSQLPFLDRAWHKPVSFVGKYALFFYFGHMVAIPLILMLVSYFFMTPGSWGLF